MRTNRVHSILQPKLLGAMSQAFHVLDSADHPATMPGVNTQSAPSKGSVARALCDRIR